MPPSFRRKMSEFRREGAFWRKGGKRSLFLRRRGALSNRERAHLMRWEEPAGQGMVFAISPFKTSSPPKRQRFPLGAAAPLQGNLFFSGGI